MSEDDLVHLNAWPEDTLGFQQEHVALKQLLFLCQTEGYGRIQQMIDDINDIWRHPENVNLHKKARSERFKQLGWKP